MSRLRSPYYPPRATWYSPFFHVVRVCKQTLWLHHILRPIKVSGWKILAALVIPGYAFLARGRRSIGRIAMWSYGVLAVIFILWLGYPVAGFAFGLMLSIHGCSILFLFQPLLLGVRLPFRLAVAIVLLLLLGVGFYAPIRQQVENHWLLPMRLNERVIITRTWTTPASIRRGDWVAYNFPGGAGAGLVWHGGIGLRPVLARGGDRVKFLPDRFEVNGLASPRQKHMPTSGELIVPQKYWFIWPEFVIPGHASDAAVAEAKMQNCLVSENQFIGKSFQRWFWRRQQLP